MKRWGSLGALVLIATLAACDGFGSPDTHRFDVIEIDTLIGLPDDSLIITDVNDALQLVGWRTVGTVRTGFMWNGSALIDLPCIPQSINSLGQVGCFLPSGTATHSAALWQDGQLTQLPINGPPFMAVHVTDSGFVMVGFGGGRALFRWRAGAIDSIPEFINGVGRPNARGDLPYSTIVLGYFAARVWWQGPSRITGSLGSGGRYSHAEAVNDSGEVVGYAERQPLGGTVATGAFRANAFKGETLGSGSFITHGAAHVNNRGDVVGDGSRGAFLLANRSMMLLDDLCACGRTLSSARKITQSGAILVLSQRGTEAKEFVLLKPTL